MWHLERRRKLIVEIRARLAEIAALVGGLK